MLTGWHDTGGKFRHPGSSTPVPASMALSPHASSLLETGDPYASSRMLRNFHAFGRLNRCCGCAGLQELLAPLSN